MNISHSISHIANGPGTREHCVGIFSGSVSRRAPVFHDAALRLARAPTSATLPVGGWRERDHRPRARERQAGGVPTPVGFITIFSIFTIF